MNAPTKGSGTTWVGRSIRRLEDPALVTGRGRFTARSGRHALGALRAQPGRGRPHHPHRAAGRRDRDHGGRPARREADPADAAQVQLCAGRPADPRRRRRALRRRTDRGRGRIERGRGRGHRRSRRGRDRGHAAPGRCARGARRRRAGVHSEAANNVIVEGRVKTQDFDAIQTGAHRRRHRRIRSRRQNAMPLEARGGHAAFDAATGRITLTCSTQMPHLMRTAIADLLGMPESDLRVVAPDVGGGFGQKMSLPPEYVRAGVAGAEAAQLGRLDRGPPREPDRLLPQPRPVRRRSKAPSTRTASCSRSPPT